MENKLLYMMLAVLLTAALLVPRGNATVQSDMEIQNIDFPGYELTLPVRVVIGFTYTQNYSITVKTFGQSMHSQRTSPTSIDFVTNEVDIYQIFIDVYYDVTVNQTITIGLFEGNKTIKPMKIAMTNNGFHIEMTVTATQPATFPSAEEISDVMWSRWRNELEGLEFNLADAMGSMSGALAVTVGFGIIAFFVVLAIAFWLFRIHRRVAKLEAHGITRSAP
jgi:hypothetical protein